MLFGAFSECKWNLSIICIQIAAAGFFCSHQLRLFCIPPSKTHWRDSADWLREFCSAFILHPPKLLKVPPGTEWIRDTQGKDKESVCPLSGVSCALYWHSTEGFRDRKTKCGWEGCRRGRKRSPVPMEYFLSPGSLMLQGSALASAKYLIVVDIQGFRFPWIVHRGISAITVSACPFLRWLFVPAGKGAGETGVLGSPSQATRLEGCAPLSLRFPSRQMGKALQGPPIPCLLHPLSDLRSHHSLWAMFFLVPGLTLLPSFPGWGKQC